MKIYMVITETAIQSANEVVYYKKEGDCWYWWKTTMNGMMSMWVLLKVKPEIPEKTKTITLSEFLKVIKNPTYTLEILKLKKEEEKPKGKYKTLLSFCGFILLYKSKEKK